MKSLFWFWVAVLLALAAGAAVLQALGPLPAPPAPAPRPATARGQTPALPPSSLLEPAPNLPGRMLPRIGPNGLTPATAYATPAPAAGNRHRIALVIDGIGLDQALSERAIRVLPRTVTLAFSAYTPDGAAERLGSDARVAAHECLVSVPMQPADTPVADEGTRALAIAADGARNRDNLAWALSRIAGCVGATGASDGGSGERFAASGPAFRDMLDEIHRRGLLYLDPRPGAAPADAPGLRAADLVIDKTASVSAPVTAPLLDERLAALEQVARDRGSAVGIAGPPLPVLIDRIAAWAKGLDGRGFVLVPLSDVMAPPTAEK